MKILRNLIILVLLFGLMGYAPDKKVPIQGVWELVKGKYVAHDTVINYPSDPSGKHMKNIAQKYFSTIWQGTKNEMEGFNGGSYKLEGDIYTEHITHSSWINDVGTKVTFKVKVEGDRLFMKPVNEKGEVKSYGFFEEWKRLE